MKLLSPLVFCATFSFAMLSVGRAQSSPPPAPQPSSASDSNAPSASAGGGEKLDFGDYSSAALTAKAWQALDGKDYAAVQGYTDKCITMFKDKAVEMQKGMTEAPDTSDKEKVFANWALNDVGTCYYIQAKADEDQGNTKGAIDAYKFLSDNLAYAECWDPKGWFWSPAGSAKERLAALQFDSIK